MYIPFISLYMIKLYLNQFFLFKIDLKSNAK